MTRRRGQGDWVSWVIGRRLFKIRELLEPDENYLESDDDDYLDRMR